MRKLFYLLVLAAIVMGCSKEEMMPSTGEYTLTGYSAVQTKTDFGTPGNSSIPFVWSVGDKIWSGEAQSSAANINPDGSASFSFATEPTGTVYYNMTGSSATTAVVPAQQDASKTLGENGDFGYATVSNGSFTLQHATAYLWFDVTALPSEATLESITVDADNAAIAGKAKWNGSEFTNKSETSGKITLSVNKTSVSEDAADIAMVVLPAKVESATVTYALTVDGSKKYYEQNLQERTLAAGNTYKISVDLSSVSLYELRVLTFEDKDAEFSPYTLEYCSKEITTWSDLIAANQFSDNLLYSYSQTEDDLYNWVDTDNTFLAHRLPYNYDAYAYWGGGHAISNYSSNDYVTHGNYEFQLTVYDKDANGLVTQGSGHNGSDNFAMHYGYCDGSDWNQTTMDALPAIYFADNQARVIDHMWVCLSAYEYYCIYQGNDLTAPMGNGDYVKIDAIGHKEDGTTETISIKVADFSAGVIDDWCKWDLSSLGKVKSVQFNIIGTNDNGYGFSQPAYFAYDDVAVRFEE